MLEISKRKKEELLHLATKNGQVSLIKNLLKTKVDINALNAEGLSPLHLAVIEGNIEVTNLLISEGANIEIKDSKWGSSPLLYACQNGRTKLVQMLLQNGANINSKSYDGSTAIHFAAQSGKTDLVIFLQQMGFDINSQNDSQQTPLMFAIMADDINAVTLLISLGADVDHGRNCLKPTPLHCAASFKSGQQDKIIQILIHRGAHIHAQCGVTLTTPLHTNILNNGSIKSARVLLENGAHLQLKNRFGENAFQLALRYHNTKFIKLALEFQPNLVTALNLKNDHPIEYILQQANKSALKVIFHHCHRNIYH